ncbi:MAG TPA: carbohydrate ABC transporter permease [Defluviitoga tunisiensis]|jgi:multiple sugar transport system permease protein|uniref:ABC-type sugar transport system, permease component n=1 Tax=Defluviitoga tunisiensis TaxID=1006576 RepID=A0A0C7P0X7_DEFTU|nr:carbohydrate ABC transporter permease [Defluviitoga tunisiensis]HOP25109.1 carbohydrate ABC transporter permease [Defluviitoga sp.]MDD3601179.1 carbohydrate ABC transporter permease [Defluviitoga tunisiensis]MDY0379619.1 carbohydrate ABC transporter permease [Defluviitoga tunisiensis]CEP77664.1 ABC-type sugar transport system, permease component [Defluviitoga tunisiensis]HOB55262.1 carbohydrate ABC transporter permease [Defluviitoga tunisiensis]
MRKIKVSPIEQIVVHLILIIWLLISVIPFLWMLSTSFKGPGEIFLFPPKWIPKNPTLKNYKDLFQQMNFGRPFLNSIIVSLSTTFLSVVLATMAGYGFAKFNFKNKNVLFLIILGTVMVPGQITMIPVFLLLTKLNLLNTYWGLILPALANAFNIFFMRQFISGIPDELIEAAKMDGANEGWIFFKVILPLSKPAMAAITIFTFTGSWNNFLWPLIIATDESMYTLPVAISVLGGQYTENIAMQMAGSVIVILPLIIVFLFTQKYFIKGITFTGLKG